MSTTAGTDQSAHPKPALVSALTTEHYTLQSARSSTVIEANGRSQLFLAALTGAVVALALVAELDGLGRTFNVFALSLLPAVLALGLTTYTRLADLAVQDGIYARAIGRIRAFYFTIEPTAVSYWMLPAGDHPHAIMRQAGREHSRWHHMSHAATAVAALASIVAGVLYALVAHVGRSAEPPLLAAGASVVAAGAFALLMLDQGRRWRRAEAAHPTLFGPDGRPAVQAGGIPSPSRPQPVPATSTPEWSFR